MSRLCTPCISAPSHAVFAQPLSAQFARGPGADHGKHTCLLCCHVQLVNYPDYRNHEMKALFEWLGRTQRELEVFSIRGPLEGKDYAVELTPTHDLGGFQQSVGFIVVT